MGSCWMPGTGLGGHVHAPHPCKRAPNEISCEGRISCFGDFGRYNLQSISSPNRQSWFLGVFSNSKLCSYEWYHSLYQC